MTRPTTHLDRPSALASRLGPLVLIVSPFRRRFLENESSGSSNFKREGYSWVSVRHKLYPCLPLQ